VPGEFPLSSRPSGLDLVLRVIKVGEPADPGPILP
jgi:hypothetical protein